jgi:mannitol/fructose-specific phosphotransferase system IIA component (Ntr-type)
MRILLEALQAGRLFELTETSKRGAFEFLGRVLEAIPEIPDDSGVVEAMFAREATGNTAIAPGVACPHARVEGINAEIFCALGWSFDGIDYEAEDGNRVNLVVAYWIPDCQRVGFLKEMMLLEKLHRLADDIAAATGSSRGTASLDAHHAIVSLEDKILRAQFFRVKIDRFEDVDHGRDQALGEREGRVMLRVAADLQNPLAEFREGGGKIRGRRRFSDPAFAIDRENLRRANRNRRIEMDLHAAFAILAAIDGPGSAIEKNRHEPYS